MRYDVAIVGSGPAAISAALNLHLHEKSILWFGSPELSQKVERSRKIANYPGVPMVTGPALNRLFREQIAEAGLEILPRQVTNILSTRRGFMLQGGEDIYDATTVLLCIGAVSAKGFTGEERLLGSGVSYCATCDGFLYKGKTIAVYCAAPQFEHEVEYLAELADRVYLFTPYKDCTLTRGNIVPMNCGIKEILGEPSADSLLLSDGTTLPVDGVFLLRPAVAPGTLMHGLELEGPHIVVDRQMRTSKPGCFAAGDCTGLPYQIAKATGEGNIAAHSIVQYLAEKQSPRSH